MRTHGRVAVIGGMVGICLLLAAAPARAIPAFARKYGTSCETCHTVYPKLTPFGEAFRRNGFLFPGEDNDYIKGGTVALGQDAYKKVFPNAVWPGTVADSVPIAVGINGQAMFHPDTKSSAAKADNNTMFSFNDLVAEAHLFAGGSFSENITYFSEVTLTNSGVSIEHANVHFNNLFGPKHLFNLTVGRFFPTLTSFGTHSSYVADTIYPGMSVTGLYGSATPSFNLADKYNGVELSGTAAGRFIYSIGANAGANLDMRPTENAYAHVGFKVGGMRLDGEGDTAGNPDKPWAENSFTADVFGYRSASHYTPAAQMGTDGMGNPTTTARPDADDTTWLAGANVRLQLQSFELNAGAYNEWHNSGFLDSNGNVGGGKALAFYGEASYIVFPWLVPAFRAELIQLSPDNATKVSEWRLMPGIAALIRPNLKLLLTSQIEIADGMPDGGWGAAGGFAAPMPGAKVKEVENIQATFAYAF